MIDLLGVSYYYTDKKVVDKAQDAIKKITAEINVLKENKTSIIVTEKLKDKIYKDIYKTAMDSDDIIKPFFYNFKQREG